MKPLGPNEGGNRHRHPDCRFCDESQRLNLGIMAENRALKAKLAPVEGQARLYKQLLARLKAEVETLRRLQKHEEEMQAQWEREAPLQDDQAWSAQNVASASKEAADRLEHLIKQAGGEQ